jgi:hypothetical protein
MLILHPSTRPWVSHTWIFNDWRKWTDGPCPNAKRHNKPHTHEWQFLCPVQSVKTTTDAVTTRPHITISWLLKLKLNPAAAAAVMSCMKWKLTMHFQWTGACRICCETEWSLMYLDKREKDRVWSDNIWHLQFSMMAYEFQWKSEREAHKDYTVE